MDCQMLHVNPCSFYQVHHMSTAKPTSHLSNAPVSMQHNESETTQITYKLIFTFFLLLEESVAFSFQSLNTRFTQINE